MPELPEVENIALGLRNEIIGLCVKDIYVKKPSIIRHPSRRHWPKAVNALTNRRITAICRRGKRLIICTDNDLAILVQLGMTGRFLLNPPSDPLLKHTHFIVNLNNNMQLRFVDPRRFGRISFIENLNCHPPATPDPAMTAAGLSPLGPEPDSFTPRMFQQLLERKRLIKPLLLDQNLIAGLGNIYTDESLFAASIHPATRACDLNTLQANKLRSKIRHILKNAIAHGGTTFSDYRNAYGQMGSFLKRLKVYQRNGLPCQRCGVTIVRIVIAGRGTFVCPQCQPLVRTINNCQ